MRTALRAHSWSLAVAQMGTLVTANQPAQENRAEVLTLTGWSALGAVFALVTLVLLGVVYGVRRFSSTRYEGYQARGLPVVAASARSGPCSHQPALSFWCAAADIQWRQRC